MTSRIEISRHFDSLFLKTYDDYCQKYNYKIKKNKITSDNFAIPTKQQYELMFTNNYELKQLKEIIKFYGLKLTGKKEILIARIFSYLYLSSFATKIQKMCRIYLSKKCMKHHGPAYINRKICVNAVDFLTMDDIKEIMPTQFFSYKDKDDFIYGFDVVSFHNLIKKSDTGVVLNPFTKSQIPLNAIREFRRMIFLSNLLNIPVNLQMNEEETSLVIKSSLEESRLLFEYIDNLGNYTNYEWFMNLSRNKLLNLITELYEIWNFRAELKNSIKIKICNPNGNPFYNENMMNRQTILEYLKSMPNIERLRLEILNILSKFVKKGLNEDYKKLGAYFVLGALTLVSNDARNSLPWLYESFSYN
jgi:hypothetical protein